MTVAVNECTRCGAPVTPDPNGLAMDCRYCGAHGRIAVEGKQLAAGLRLDKANAEALLERLAHEFGTTFADLTRVESEGGHVVAFELVLEPDLFIMKRDVRGVVAQHKRVVRGVALKTTTHPVDRWVDMLSRALAEHVNTSAQAAQALGRLKLR